MVSYELHRGRIWTKRELVDDSLFAEHSKEPESSGNRFPAVKGRECAPEQFRDRIRRLDRTNFADVRLSQKEDRIEWRVGRVADFRLAMPRRSVDAKPFLRFANDDAIVAQNPRRIVLEPESRSRRLSCARLSDEEISAAVDDDSASMQFHTDSVAEDRCDEELVEWIRERIAVSRDVIGEHDFAARECVVEARDFVWIGCE